MMLSVIFRLLMIYFPNLNLSSRPEVATPLTSIHRCTLLSLFSRDSRYAWFLLNLCSWVLLLFNVLQWLRVTGWNSRQCLPIQVFLFPFCIQSKWLLLELADCIWLSLIVRMTLPICLSRIYVSWLSSVTVSSRAIDCQKVRISLQKEMWYWISD